MVYYIITFPNNARSVIKAIATPMYVRHQKHNNILESCSKSSAGGIIIDIDGNTICLLENRTLAGFSAETNPIAREISQLEYEEYEALQKQSDIEDESPQIPVDVQEETVLTRAELTQRVEELEAQNRFLQDCLLEMSEIVYQ